MGTEINTIIDNLCERFATPASELLVEIARFNTAEMAKLMDGTIADCKEAGINVDLL